MRVSHRLIKQRLSELTRPGSPIFLWRGFARKTPKQLLKAVIKFIRASPYERALIARGYLGSWDWRVPHFGNDRTTYVIGLFGSGRTYVHWLLLQNLGKRAYYLREMIRLHPGPTSMIYSGHATIKYVCRQQHLPSVTGRILDAVRSRIADLIFINRHPVDSLLSNWIWWRTYLRGTMPNGDGLTGMEGISRVYRNADDLATDLDRNFLEFQSFAEGNPDFFASVPGPRFLSFSEFVEEAELYLQSATLSLRLEDFMIDPLKEFRKIVELMSVNIDLSCLHIAPPKAKPFRYLELKEKLPRFRAFLQGLNQETKKRVENIGYNI